MYSALAQGPLVYIWPNSHFAIFQRVGLTSQPLDHRCTNFDVFICESEGLPPLVAIVDGVVWW